MVQSSIFSALFKLQNYLKMLYDSHIIMYSAFRVACCVFCVPCSALRVSCFVMLMIGLYKILEIRSFLLCED